MGKKEDKKAEDILNEDVEAGAKAAAAAAEEVKAAENENAVPEDGVGIEQAAADIIAKMQQQEATITTLEDQVKRQMAEFDNFRKRTEREKTDMFDLGAIDVVKKLLPIVDNFERGFKTLPEGEETTCNCPMTLPSNSASSKASPNPLVISSPFHLVQNSLD